MMNDTSESHEVTETKKKIITGTSCFKTYLQTGCNALNSIYLFYFSAFSFLLSGYFTKLVLSFWGSICCHLTCMSRVWLSQYYKNGIIKKKLIDLLAISFETKIYIGNLIY